MKDQLAELHAEMKVILSCAENLWGQYPHHFPYTSYGFAMCLFSRVDLFSKYWFPKEGEQTRRMVAFLHTYLGYPEKESEIAVQFWRHKLMHTSQPRLLTEQGTGRRYKWLLQYQLASGHWSLENDTEASIFQMGLFNMASDLEAGLQKALAELPNHSEVSDSWEDVSRGLAEFKPKY